VRLASFLSTVFPHWAGLHLDTITLVEQQLRVDLCVSRQTARCPTCSRHSRRVQSHFVRTRTEQPLGTAPVRVRLHARRFRCLNASCPRRTFRERLPELAPRYQRRTPVLRQHLEAIGFALGGQAGRRLTGCLHLGTVGASRHSLLRLVRRAVVPCADAISPQLRVVGIDDFAFRRGMRYGAILVDLDQHRVSDLLPDREAAPFAAWLERHDGPQVEVVSRDRGGAFAEGARQAAPQAIQVADRFHLLPNLGHVLDRLVTREHRVLTHVAEALTNGATTTTGTEPGTERIGEQMAEMAGLAHGDATHTLAPEMPGVPATRVERERATVEARRQAR
jgi:transposase